MALALSLHATAALGQAPPAPGGEVFAVVGQKVIGFAEYQAALAAGMRQKYYHAKPPEDEVAKFQREVGDQLVNQVLLYEEAKRRGIEADRAKVQETVAGYETRYKDSEQWRATRERLLPGLVERLERQSVLERLEAAVKAAAPRREESVRAYYDGHREQFTEPEQFRVSLILLKVDPSSPRSAWDKAAEEAGRLHERLRKGADFAELARMHSADPSAARGGDLGYVHRGMLPEPIQKQVIDSLKPGVASLPVVLLEGLAIVRLEDRRPPMLRAYPDVRQRAEELLAREQGEQAWQRLIAGLRARTRIVFDESRYLPMPPS
jgi:parvulin-like peptidyl-prolyl isomerase